MSATAGPLRVSLHAADPVRRRGLAAMLEAAGHSVVDDAPDVVLCDVAPGTPPPKEAEAPVLALADRAIDAAGVLPRGVDPGLLDPALRAVAAGLLVRVPGAASTPAGFRAAEDTPPLTPREAEVLALVGQGMSNKAVARRLGISLHTVKFHLEALFEKLGASSRAQAVAIGLRGGAIEL
jgi:DNA-binding CsgD family transcriptional regulator